MTDGEGVGRRDRQETLTLKGHTDDVYERGVQPRRPAARLRELTTRR